MAGHVRELLGAHAQGRPLEPPHQRQGDRSADAQGRSGHESRREDLAADVGALHRGADPHGDKADHAAVVLARVDRHLGAHRGAEGARLLVHVLLAGQRAIGGGGQVLADLGGVRMGEAGSVDVGDHHELDLGAAAHLLGLGLHGALAQHLDVQTVLGGGLRDLLAQLGVLGQGARCGQRMRGIGLGHGARSQPGRGGRGQGQDQHDHGQLRDEHPSREGSGLSRHGPSVVRSTPASTMRRRRAMRRTRSVRTTAPGRRGDPYGATSITSDPTGSGRTERCAARQQKEEPR